MISESAKRIVQEGSVKARVKRSGMFQLQTFTIKRVSLGADKFVELFVGRIIDMTELQRVANEFGLPVEAENGRAFPMGLGAKDFVNL